MAPKTAAMRSCLNFTQSFLETARAEVERLKGLKEELEEEKAKLNSNLEKAQARVKTTEASATMAEGIQKRTEESYTQVYREKLNLQEELKTAREVYASLQESVVMGMDKMFENLKAQVQVLAPEINLSLFSQDNIVVDGKIVPAPKDKGEELVPDPKTQGGEASWTPEVQPETINV